MMRPHNACIGSPWFLHPPLIHHNMISNCSDIMVPLTTADRQLAQVLAAAHPDPDQRTQIDRNTLSVQAMQTYFRWMQVPVDLDQSRSQNQPQADVADLYLPELGQRVECCVVRSGETHCHIAPSQQTGRLGYVAVQLDEPGYEAKLIGFLPQAKWHRLRSQIPDGQVALGQFEPLDQLLLALTPAPTPLSSWLRGEFPAHWQRLSTLASPLPEFACLPIVADLPTHPTDESDLESLLAQLRSVPEDDEESRWKLVERLWSLKPDHPAAGVRRGVDLGMYLAGAAIALVVSVLPKPNGAMAILLRVYPTQQTHLPPGLQLAGLYESGVSFLDATARAHDNYIQLKFSALAGERFGVQVRHGDGEYMEHFMV
jgi:Protein of unknown function (DUF1822)